MKKVCCFAGHSVIYDNGEILASVIKKAENLILHENVTEFRVGNYGAFDRISKNAITKLKEKYPVKLILVIPYLTKEINEYKDFYKNSFDEIIIAPIPQSTPKRLSIIKCNEYMVESSDFIICHIKDHTTGADKTLSYAKRKKLNILSV